MKPLPRKLQRRNKQQSRLKGRWVFGLCSTSVVGEVSFRLFVYILTRKSIVLFQAAEELKKKEAEAAKLKAAEEKATKEAAAKKETTAKAEAGTLSMSLFSDFF